MYTRSNPLKTIRNDLFSSPNRAGRPLPSAPKGFGNQRGAQGQRKVVRQPCTRRPNDRGTMDQRCPRFPTVDALQGSPGVPPKPRGWGGFLQPSPDASPAEACRGHSGQQHRRPGEVQGPQEPLGIVPNALGARGSLGGTGRSCMPLQGSPGAEGF